MSIKLEKRGKYGGTKAHLEAEDCQLLLDAVASPGKQSDLIFIDFGRKLAFKIQSLLKEIPTLLQDRSPEEIEAELREEAAKATMKLAKKKAGMKWNEELDPSTCLLIVMTDGEGETILQAFQGKSFGEWKGWEEWRTHAPIPDRVRVRALGETT